MDSKVPEMDINEFTNPQKWVEFFTEKGRVCILYIFLLFFL